MRQELIDLESLESRHGQTPFDEIAGLSRFRVGMRFVSLSP